MTAPLANSRHEAFAQNVADGMAEADAYLAVYGGKKRSARTLAPRLLANVVVRARVDALKEQNARAKGLSRERKRAILAEIAETAKDARERIQAIAEDNRMTGDLAATGGAAEGVVFVFNPVRKPHENN